MIRDRDWPLGLILTALWILAFLTLIIFLGGCTDAQWQSWFHPSHAPTPPPTPPANANLTHGLDFLAFMSIIAVGVAVTLLMLLPSSRLPVAIGGGAVTVLVVALVVKATLPLLIWVAGGIAILAFAYAGYELFLKLKAQREANKNKG